MTELYNKYPFLLVAPCSDRTTSRHIRWLQPSAHIHAMRRLPMRNANQCKYHASEGTPAGTAVMITSPAASLMDQGAQARSRTRR